MPKGPTYQGRRGAGTLWCRCCCSGLSGRFMHRQTTRSLPTSGKQVLEEPIEGGVMKIKHDIGIAHTFPGSLPTCQTSKHLYLPVSPESSIKKASSHTCVRKQQL